MNKHSAMLIAFAMLTWVAAMPVHAREDYWKPECADGATLEQYKKKLEFRCRRDGAMVTQYTIGRCDRPLKLRRAAGYRYNYMCLGTTIGTKGDAGTRESFDNYECRSGYKKNRSAAKPTEACKKSVPGSTYERPVFTGP